MSDGDITIVGGGWSVRNFPTLARLVGHVIAVNDAAVHLPAWGAAVSMDRLWTENRWEKLRELTAGTARQVYLRRSAVQNIPDPRLPGYQVFDCDNTTNDFTGLHGRLNGTNSGACALNLAWQLKPRRVFLLGFDMNRDPATGRAYWYPPYPWSAPAGGTSDRKYRDWAVDFERAAQDFADIGGQVYNVSPQSAIRAFPKMSPTEYLRFAT